MWKRRICLVERKQHHSFDSICYVICIVIVIVIYRPVEKDPQSDTAGLPPPPFFHSVQQEASREMEGGLS